MINYAQLIIDSAIYVAVATILLLGWYSTTRA